MNIKFLISYAYWGGRNLNEQFGSNVTIFGDSGGFTMKQQGVDLDIAEYAAWCDKWKHRLAAYANLDLIGDPKGTIKNQRWLERQGLHPVPVYHVGEPWSVFEDYCDDYDYIAVGGMAMSNREGQRRTLMKHMIRCHQIAQDKNTVLHAFGITGTMLIGSLPWYSADSTSWLAGVRFGGVQLWDPMERKWQRFTVRDHAEAYKHRELIRGYGTDPAVIAGGVRNTSSDTFNWPEAMRLQGRAYMAYERYIRKRFGPIKLEGHPDGFHLYLAVSADTHSRDFARTLQPSRFLPEDE